MREPVRVNPPKFGMYFAWIRTLLATERTLKAETRTSVSLIAFGFTIVEFFERLRVMGVPGRPVRVEAPRDLGLALIAAGVASALTSIWQYRRLMGRLWGPDLSIVVGEKRKPLWTPTAIVLFFVCLIGIYAFVAILMHLA